jgi:hypothetical protein
MVIFVIVVVAIVIVVHLSVVQATLQRAPVDPQPSRRLALVAADDT